MGDAILYCDRCAKLIPPSVVGAGAIVTDQVTLCAECAASLTPQQREALRAAKTATARERAIRKTPAPVTGRSRQVAGSKRTIVVIATFAAGALAGIAGGLIAISGGADNEAPSPSTGIPVVPAPAVVPSTAGPATPSLDAAAVRGADEPGVTAPPALDPLVEVRTRLDPRLSRYDEIRADLAKLIAAGGEHAEGAKRLLAETDEQYAKLAEDALSKARKGAEGMVAGGAFEEAAGTVRAVLEEYAEGPWAAGKGARMVDAALREIESARGKAIDRVLARARDALSDGKCASAKMMLASRDGWPDDAKERAGRLVARIEEAQQRAAKVKLKELVWLRFAGEAAAGGARGVDEVKKLLAARRAELSEYGLDAEADRAERRLRDAALVESLAEDALRASRGRIRVRFRGRPITGKVVKLENRVLTIKPVVGADVEIPLGEVGAKEMLAAAGLLRGESADLGRAAGYYLTRGDAEAARTTVDELVHVSDELRADIDTAKRAVELQARLAVAWSDAPAPEAGDAKTPVVGGGVVAEFSRGAGRFSVGEVDAGSYADVSAAAGHVAERPVLVVKYAMKGPGGGDGINVTSPLGEDDWSTWRLVVARIYLPDAQPCRARLVIDTARKRGQSSGEFGLAKGWNMVWLEVSSLAGADDVRGVTVRVTPTKRHGASNFAVGSIELAREGPLAVASRSGTVSAVETFEREPALAVHRAKDFGAAIATATAPVSRGSSLELSWNSPEASRLEVVYREAGPQLPTWRASDAVALTAVLLPRGAAAPKSFAVWLRDVEGELFEWRARCDIRPGAWGKATIPITLGEETGSWGKKADGELDMPVRLAGFAVEPVAGEGAVYIDDISLEPVGQAGMPANFEPFYIGELLRKSTGHPNDFAKLDYRALLNDEQLTRIVAAKPSRAESVIFTASAAGGANDRSRLPSWLDASATLPQGEIKTPLAFGYRVKWGSSGTFAPLRGVVGPGPKSETFDLTLVPSKTLPPKRVAVGMWRAHLVRGTVRINSITLGSGASARTRDVGVAVDLGRAKWGVLAAHAFSVPIVENTPIVFNVTATCQGKSDVLSVGVWFMFEE